MFTELRKAANPRLVLGNAVHHIARVENGSSLSAFEQQQQARPSTPSVPPPVPTKLTPPAGTAPVQLPNAAPAPISGLPPIGLPKLDSPAPSEKK